MGFFNKKKDVESRASVLSESEIQKKLYGEFNLEGELRTTREQESFREVSAPMQGRETSSEKEAAPDLFSVPKDAPAPSRLSTHGDFTQSQPTDHAPRYVPLQDFEKKTISSSSPSTETDPYARFRYNRPQEKGLTGFLNLLTGLAAGLGDLFRNFKDPKQAALRKIFFWGLAICVITLLFLGVNALNSQRDEAMRTRYKLHGETAPLAIPAQAQEKVAALSKPVVEREVVITPAPVRPKKPSGVDAGVTAPVQSAGSFVIQVVTYPTRQDADQVVGSLRREGFRAFVKEDTRPTGRVFYLVLLGGFRTESEAQAQLLKFRSKEIARPFQDAFVKSSRA